MRLTKAQVSAISYELRAEFREVGERESKQAIGIAEQRFWSTPKGKAVLAVRKAWSDKDLMRYDVEQALKDVAKPFRSPLTDFRDSEIEHAIQLASITVDDITELKNAVRKHFYAKLKPAVRKRFGLKL